MPGTSGWDKVLKSGSFTWSLSLDGLRSKLARGLEVRVEQPEARRGEEIEALVVVSEPERFGAIEVGLLCTEHYDEEMRSYSGGRSHTTRTTSEDTAYEQWQPLPRETGEHAVRVAIPAEAPFSYAGECLSFTWEIVARGVRDRALDARASQEISVRP
jgi:hypothetical protein